MKIITFAFASTLALAAAALPAQTINQRKTDQQDRIANGVRSGQLTARETGHLERQERDLNREERDMRKLNNGHLTRSDRATLNRQQNAESRRIYREKHNSFVR